MPKKKPAEKWRPWQPLEQKAEPKRTCSTAGCTAAPTRVKETRTPAGRIRRHAYCQKHAKELEE